MPARFEYADEASCILDRTGTSYRLLGGGVNGHHYRVVARLKHDPTRMHWRGGTYTDTADLWYVEVERR